MIDTYVYHTLLIISYYFLIIINLSHDFFAISPPISQNTALAADSYFRYAPAISRHFSSSRAFGFTIFRSRAHFAWPPPYEHCTASPTPASAPEIRRTFPLRASRITRSITRIHIGFTRATSAISRLSGDFSAFYRSCVILGPRISRPA
jgi:hypothetical protein